MKKSKMRKTWIAILTALCMVFTMIPAVGSAGSTADTSVTVYVSISKDGEFVTGNDTNQTVMARVPITVDYFDLADYGLEQYYRYPTTGTPDSNGFPEYDTSQGVLQQPTVLHLLIRALETYYLNGGELTVPSDALAVADQAAMSLYLTKFWGHGYNLMYYTDHQYPVMGTYSNSTTVIGSTADYILLEDGMEVDLAMYDMNNMDFYLYGAFSHFDRTDVAVKTGESFTLTLKGALTSSATGELQEPQAMPDEVIRIGDEDRKNWDYSKYTTDGSGQVTLSFDAPGTYYISGGDENHLYTTFKDENPTDGVNEDPCVAPAICKVTVTEDSTTPEAGGGAGGGAAAPEEGGDTSDEPAVPEEGGNATTPEAGGTGNDAAAPEAGGDANDAPAAPEQGDVVTDPETGAEFEVIDTDEGEKSVAFVGTEDDGDKKVTIPATVMIDGEKYKVTSIDNGAFKGNKNLKTVKVSKNVETIGNNAFRNCTQLKTVKLGRNVEVIGKNAFSGCKNLKEIVIPANVEKIGAKAFYNAKNLKKITIKTDELSRGDIGNNAFKGTPAKAVVKAPKGKAGDYEKLLKAKGLHKKATVK